ncbi:energy transducer TonB [Brevundimonas sp.]|uniref:energy transducer TonB n=1 Tax=Brevundimonas sp. TaxID=1871086 RepID=UPI002D6A1748|nr:energy transducer TonB [Brevundimonas sp.]HYC73536.1 energy transducer TonB [Brevundimonas sp.]
MWRAAIVAAVIALVAAPANAQQPGDDWDLIVDESQDMMLAVVGYSSGQTLAVRCRDGDLELLLSGLPPLEGTTPQTLEGGTRRIEAAYSDGRVEAGYWFSSGDGSLVFSPVPRLDARRLRQGGALQLSVAVDADPTAPLRRYALDLPTDTANLDQVLAACDAGRPEARDEMARWSIPPEAGVDFWRRHPAPRYPETAAHLGSGFVVFSCISAGNGRLTDCRTERESHHRRFRFGEEALKSLRDARIAPADEGGPPAGRLIIATIRFRLVS